MKNTKNRAIALFILCITCLFSSTSCKKDWLDKKNDIKLSTPETLKDFQALMDNSGVMNTNSPAMGEMATDGHYMTDANFSTRDDSERNPYIWSNNPAAEFQTDWTTIYRTVFYCNVVLEGLEKIKNNLSESDQHIFNDVKGQALFCRSKSFYEASQIWSPPYSTMSSTTDMGIPLRLSSDANVMTTRSTLKQTYDQIINDLLAAKELLPNNTTAKTRGSKTSTFALLARIYLSMEEYALAKENADACLNNYNTLLDYNTLDSTVTTPIPRLNGEIVFYSSIITFGTLGSRLLIEPLQKSLYHPNDLRGAIFFGKGTGSTITFKGSYGTNVSIQFNGLAIDEIYLIRAECNARMGNADLAMIDLNTLLKKRWKKTVVYPNFTAANSENALIQVLQERKKELLLRGLRWSDLRRLNRDNRFKQTLIRTVAGTTYTLEPNSYKYTFPIGLGILRLTAIQQNIGWE